MAKLTLELPNFEGPLDLLLHLIKEQKIDIYDIPIAKITSQYLSYIKRWQQMNLQIAGEYFIMSSTLLRIKSQMLLPQNDFAPAEDSGDDPREELVEQLLQYSIFKKVASYLRKRNDEIPLTAAKEASVQKDKGISPLPAGQITPQELANTFALVFRRYQLLQPNATSIKVKEVSVAEMVDLLKNKLATKKSISFFALARTLKNLNDAISLFLAILSLCKNKFLTVDQGESFGDLTLKRVKKNEQ